MSSADLRYPSRTVWADYVRAVLGTLLCGVPLLLVEVNLWVALILGAGFILFGAFLVRTVLRQRTHYVLGPDTLAAAGPVGATVEWAGLDRLKLSYFSTKRDRSEGWMQLAIGSTGGRTVKVDSALAGFHDVVERAAQAAGARGLELSMATRANLRSMGISVAGWEETA